MQNYSASRLRLPMPSAERSSRFTEETPVRHAILLVVLWFAFLANLFWMFSGDTTTSQDIPEEVAAPYQAAINALGEKLSDMYAQGIVLPEEHGKVSGEMVFVYRELVDNYGLSDSASSVMNDWMDCYESFDFSPEKFERFSEQQTMIILDGRRSQAYMQAKDKRVRELCLADELTRQIHSSYFGIPYKSRKPAASFQELLPGLIRIYLLLMIYMLCALLIRRTIGNPSIRAYSKTDLLDALYFLFCWLAIPYGLATYSYRGKYQTVFEKKFREYQIQFGTQGTGLVRAFILACVMTVASTMPKASIAGTLINLQTSIEKLTQAEECLICWNYLRDDTAIVLLLSDDEQDPTEIALSDAGITGVAVIRRIVYLFVLILLLILLILKSIAAARSRIAWFLLGHEPRGTPLNHICDPPNAPNNFSGTFVFCFSELTTKEKLSWHELCLFSGSSGASV